MMEEEWAGKEAVLERGDPLEPEGEGVVGDVLDLVLAVHEVGRLYQLSLYLE